LIPHAIEPKKRAPKADMRTCTDDLGSADVISLWTLGLAARINRSEMDDVAFSRLNQRQRECLRLVYRNLEAKEIARELGLSPHTVVEHLRDARRALGASRSMHAARMLIEYEQDNRIGYDPVGVNRQPNAAMMSVVPVTAMSVAAGIRKNRYNFSQLERLGLIVGIALGIIALTGALAMGAHVVTQILVERHIDLSDSAYRR
jgi:DNA-binding CsgD family transcriptional regulator